MGSAVAPQNSLLYKDFKSNPALVITTGEGIYLNVNDGRRILDATSGAAVACLGYDNEKVQMAMIAQMSNVSYLHPGFYKTNVAEQLADFLVASTDGQMSKAVLTGSGSEAVEVALKLAKTYFMSLSPPQPKRTRFITRAGAWHGATLGALTLGDFKARKDPFVTMIADNVSRVSACSVYRGKEEGESDENYVQRLAAELDAEFNRVGPGNVCAFVAETVGGSATGCATAVPGYFAAIKKVCERHGALLILDEIMCGMGRTGTLHAWQQESVVPDIQTVGKGLGAGYGAISAVLLKNSLVSAFQQSGKSFAHGQTYMAHPLSAAAALKTQQIIRQDGLVDNVKRMGKYFEFKLKETFSEHPHVGDIRGRGLFWAVEFVLNKATKEPFPQTTNLAARLHDKGLSKGYEIGLFNATGAADGYAGDHLVLAPPYIVDERDIDEIVRRLRLVVEDTFKEIATPQLQSSAVGVGKENTADENEGTIAPKLWSGLKAVTVSKWADLSSGRQSELVV